MLIAFSVKMKPVANEIPKARIRFVVSVSDPPVAPPNPMRTTLATIMREPKMSYLLSFCP